MRKIYGLHNGDSVIRYIGQTNDMGRRLKEIKDVTSRQGPLLQFWVWNNLDKIKMVEVETCKDEMADVSERFWIQYYRDEGFPLLNIEEGGRDVKRGSIIKLLKDVKRQWNQCKVYQPAQSERVFLREVIAQKIENAKKPKRRKKKLTHSASC